MQYLIKIDNTITNVKHRNLPQWKEHALLMLTLHLKLHSQGGDAVKQSLYLAIMTTKTMTI